MRYSIVGSKTVAFLPCFVSSATAVVGTSCAPGTEPKKAVACEGPGLEPDAAHEAKAPALNTAAIIRAAVDFFIVIALLFCSPLKNAALLESMVATFTSKNHLECKLVKSAS